MAFVPATVSVKRSTASRMGMLTARSRSRARPRSSCCHVHRETVVRRSRWRAGYGASAARTTVISGPDNSGMLPLLLAGAWWVAVLFTSVPFDTVSLAGAVGVSGLPGWAGSTSVTLSRDSESSSARFAPPSSACT